MESLGHCARNVVGVSDQIVVLSDGHRDATDISFLECISSDGGTGNLTGDRNHRNGVHVRVSNRRDQVSGTRTRRGHTDAHAAGSERVALSGVAAGLLVAHEDVANLARVHQRVVGRQNRSAGDSEDGVDTGSLQRTDQALCSGDLVGHGVVLGRDKTRVGNEKPPGPSGTTRGARRTGWSGALRDYYETHAHTVTIAQGHAGSTTDPTASTTCRSSGRNGAASR